MSDLNVAQTIVNQMGGMSRLNIMIGAKDFLADKESVMFSFKMCKRANKCRITLLPTDLYRVELFKITRRGLECETVYSEDGLYWDMLKPVFESETGLLLSL